MAKTNTNPEVRFAGFTEDWIASKLGNIGEVKMCKRIFNNQTSPKGDIPFYKIGTFGKRADSYISKELYQEFRNKYPFPKEGDILISASGTLGRIVVYDGKPAYFQDSNIVWLNHNESKILNDFLYYIYGNITYESEGGTIQRLYNSIILNSRFSFPESIDEQKLIGNFFENIDKLIAEHQRKHSKLKSLKHAMLDKMFPKQGLLIPEIRFKGFEGDWEEINVGSICKTTIGVFVIKTRQNDLSPYPVYNGGVSYTGFYDEYNNEANKIVISARGANAGFVNIVRTKYWAGNSCYSVDVLDKELFDIDFLFYYIKKYQRRFLENQQAANIPSVSKSDVERFKVFYPSKTEQSVIAKYLLSLDNQISNHDLQIIKLQNIKKAFLAKMFI